MLGPKSQNNLIIYAEVAQLVEHHLAKVRVAGSSLVFRSTRNVVNVPFLFASI